VHALVLQHVACESPGAYEEVLRERGWSSTCVELDEGESLPETLAFDGVIVMGGPMSANDDPDLPWLAAEKRLIAEAALDGVPVWGVCLGAQLLAASLGARVYAGAEPEVGISAVTLTSAASSDPVFARVPEMLPTLQWHGDSFELPDGATLLAESALYRNQAFRVGDAAYGLQFHLEVSEQMAAKWLELPAYGAALERALGRDGAARLIGDIGRRGDEILAHGREIFARWLSLAEMRSLAAARMA
jgi:GMP synthase-like glutamine amidotransferase